MGNDKGFDLKKGARKYQERRREGREERGDRLEDIKCSLDNFLRSSRHADYITEMKKQAPDHLGYLVVAATDVLKRIIDPKTQKNPQTAQTIASAVQVLDKLGYASHPGVFKQIMNAERAQWGTSGGTRETAEAYSIVERVVNKYGPAIEREFDLVYSQDREPNFGSNWSYKIRRRKVLAPAIIGIVVGIFFLSSNITGNVIGSLNQTSSNWIGIILFVIGLIGAFAYFRKGKKKK
jgi:hypothetical protein